MGDLPRILASVVAIAVLVVGFRLGLRAVDVESLPWPEGVTDERPSGAFRTVSVPEEPWFLLIGSSGIFHAFDPDQLSAPVRKQSRPGGYPWDVAYALAWNLRHTLPEDRRPVRILWGVNLASFVDRSAEGTFPCDGYARTSRPDGALDAVIEPCAPTRRALPRSVRWARRGLGLDPWYGRRRTTQDLVGAWLGTAVLGSARPPDPERYDRLGEANLRAAIERMRGWERLGVFEGQVSPAARRATQAVVDLAREAHVPLTFVRMPEHGRSRREYAPGVQEAFVAFLETHGEVVDLFDAIPNTGFLDQAHPNEEGREVASARLDALLRGWLER